MNVKQKLSILFFLKRKKVTKDGKMPIYVRITVDGQKDEFSLTCKVLSEHWNNERKTVSSEDPDSESINKKVRQAETDLERHFDLVQAKNGLASPALVKESYLTPVCGQQIKEDNQKNRALCKAVDTLISQYLQYCKKVKKAWADGRTPSQGKQDEFEQQKKTLSAEIKEYAKEANGIFDKATHQKTSMLTQIIIGGNGLYIIGRKGRWAVIATGSAFPD